jgi:hypothetical protein
MVAARKEEDGLCVAMRECVGPYQPHVINRPDCSVPVRAFKYQYPHRIVSRVSYPAMCILQNDEGAGTKLAPRAARITDRMRSMFRAIRKRAALKSVQLDK